MSITSSPRRLTPSVQTGVWPSCSVRVVTTRRLLACLDRQVDPPGPDAALQHLGVIGEELAGCLVVTEPEHQSDPGKLPLCVRDLKGGLGPRQLPGTTAQGSDGGQHTLRFTHRCRLTASDVALLCAPLIDPVVPAPAEVCRPRKVLLPQVARSGKGAIDRFVERGLGCWRKGGIDSCVAGTSRHGEQKERERRGPDYQSSTRDVSHHCWTSADSRDSTNGHPMPSPDARAPLRSTNAP